MPPKNLEERIEELAASIYAACVVGAGLFTEEDFVRLRANCFLAAKTFYQHNPPAKP